MERGEVMREKRTRRLRDVRLINRLSRREKPTSKWWADPPKLIPILISVTAVTISCLSWWESHRGRLINEEINRPILSFYDFTTKHVMAGKDTTYVGFNFKIKNIGKVSSETYKFNIESLYEAASPKSTCKLDSAMRSSMYENTELISGIEKKIYYPFNIPQDCYSKEHPSFSIVISVGYVDLTTGRRFFQTHIEELQIKEETKEVEKK